MGADPGAYVYCGLKEKITPGDYVRLIAEDRITEVLAKHEVAPGDVFFLPPGRIHAIGGGCFLAEIQQTSDITYRIYDYNRPDADGKLRQLHTAEALDAIDFSPTADGRSHYTYQQNSTVQLAQCPYFTTNLLSIDKPIRKDFSQLDSFVIYLCTEGLAAVQSQDTICPIHAGECVLVPATANHVDLFCQVPTKLLEVYIDPKQWNEEGTDHSHDNDWLAKFVGDN